MSELARIVASAEAAQSRGARSALATIVSVEGSSFRRPGARLWLGDSERIGSISAGCLEHDLAERALTLLARRRPELVRYDTASETDVLWGTASGCGGRLEILLEPVTGELIADLSWIVAETAQRRAAGLVTIWDGERPRRIRIDRNSREESADPLERGAKREGMLALERGRNRFGRPAAPRGPHHTTGDVPAGGDLLLLAEAHLPPIALTLFGSGDDAYATARLAESLGWEVVLVDRSAAADPTAGVRIRTGDPEPGKLPVDERAAIVLMTHNFHRDAEILERCGRRCGGYLGVLGPARRTLELLRHAGIDPAELPTLHAPPGLDLGGETPDEIALSLVAEIQARFAGRSGGMLRAHARPIHDSAEVLGTLTELEPERSPR
ncbi:MAG TPA: XdhC family protein [Thermoanaerobaculia bacterium]|nr:XdhC family protein [Thermoanaerobaculia bacterium]